MSGGRKYSVKKKEFIINYFLVELDLICPEIDVDDFSSISSMLNF